MPLDTADLVDRLLAGQRRALARALSTVEDGDDEALRAIVAALHPRTGGSHLIGLTGSPGVGKSTLTSAVTQAMRDRGLTVAVLAVDPSSPFSGGALLGDRVRMADHAVDDGVYIRSMATRGHLGGLSWATPHALLVLEAAGFDVVIVETVGVGQAEVEIASIADSTVVVQAPGMGDAVQAAKAGIMEIADIHVVNKADRDGAQRTLRDIRGMLDMAPPGEWTPMVLATTAATGEGVEQLVEGLLAHRRWSQESGRHLRHRRAAARVQVREILLAQVRRRMAGLDEGEALEAVVAAVATRELDPYTAADRLLAEIG